MDPDSRHLEHRQRWRNKAVLRVVYDDYFARLLAACRPGSVLEIGGGSSSLASRSDRVIASDLSWAPWLHLVADAQHLPIADASIDNIAMLDVLHHIAEPARFFSEAVRVLRPQGRIVMIEPAITALSAPFYHFLHPEPVDSAADPLAPAPVNKERDFYDGNQAIPTQLFGRHLLRWQRAYPELQLVDKRFLSLFCYPLSGGYRSWSLVPAWAASPLVAFERRVEPLLGGWMGFRLMLVVQKV